MSQIVRRYSICCSFPKESENNESFPESRFEETYDCRRETYYILTNIRCHRVIASNSFSKSMEDSIGPALPPHLMKPKEQRNNDRHIDTVSGPSLPPSKSSKSEEKGEKTENEETPLGPVGPALPPGFKKEMYAEPEAKRKIYGPSLDDLTKAPLTLKVEISVLVSFIKSSFRRMMTALLWVLVVLKETQQQAISRLNSTKNLLNGRETNGRD